jgi:hypothetical protein
MIKPQGAEAGELVDGTLEVLKEPMHNSILPPFSQQKIWEGLTPEVKTTLAPDYAMANRFFDALTGNTDEDITFQFYTDNKVVKSKIPKGGRDPRARHTHKQRPLKFAFADKKQAQGCGVWIMVNAGDGKGRTAKNVVKVRAFFIDLDGSSWEPAAAALKPHMRVESSPGRWHLYWLVEDCDLGHFKAIQQAIARRFDGDKACCDLPRVLRVPGFYHMKTEPVMTILVEDNKFPRYTTQQVIDGLGLELAAVDQVTREKSKEEQKVEPFATSSPSYAYTSPTTGEMIDLTTWAAQYPLFDIVAAIKPKYALSQVVDGKQHITCPFAHEHTDTSPDLATFIVNATPPEHTSFNIHCMHSHCAARDRLEFLQEMFVKGWLPESVLIQEPLELRKPLWVTLQVKEISASPEWSILAPDERRIAWDLQYYAWQTDDGTIEDDEWRIAKFLGLPEEKWLEYRKTLKMVGWLKEMNGRLTNDIVKREFDNAQMAYSKSCAGGRRGGLKTQQNRRG